MKHIEVFAPGTVANLGCGFDVMGLTLDGVGDRMEVMVEPDAEGLEIRNESGVELPESLDENVITPAVRALLAAYGGSVRVIIRLLEKIVPGSGIGSSAASSAAAVYGINELLGRPFSAKQLVEFAMLGEALQGGTAHADNVGPALLGGVVLIRGYEPFDIVRLPVPDNFFYAVVHPQIVVSTKMAREVLPHEIPLSKAVKQWGNVGGLVAGFALRDVALIGRSMQDAVVEPYRKGFIPDYEVHTAEARKAVPKEMDISKSVYTTSHALAMVKALETGDEGLVGLAARDVLHEPYRKKLIPDYEVLRRLCLEAGAAAFLISGSGSTMLALTKQEDQAEELARAVEKAYPAFQVHVLRACQEGAKVLSA